MPAVAGVEGSLIYFIEGRATLNGAATLRPRRRQQQSGALGKSIISPMSCAAANSSVGRCSINTVLGPRAAAASRTRRPARRLLQPPVAQRRTARCGSRSTSAKAARPASRAFSMRSAARASSRSRCRPTIFSRVVESAAASGVEFLPIPENYYDDLAARYRSRARFVGAHAARSASSTIESRTANSFTSTHARSRIASSSRSSSATITICSAPPTRPSASRPRQVSRKLNSLRRS